MKAIQIKKHGDSSILKSSDIEQPSCPKNKIKVKIKASSINHLDIWVRNGIKGLDIPLPLILGSDGSGIVVEVGPGIPLGSPDDGISEPWKENKNEVKYIPTQAEIGDYALFTSSEYKPINGLIIRPGLRYSYNTSYKSPLIPSLNLRYNRNDWIFRTSYSSGFRAPSIKDLYFNFVDSNHDIQGNPNLTAETSHNFSFSGVKTIVKKNNI